MVRAKNMLLLAGLAMAGCREAAPPPAPPMHGPPTPESITAAAVAAVAAAPWDTDPTGWGALCSPRMPCDTIIIEPRIVELPSQAPAFFVPERRPLAVTLDPSGFDRSALPGRHLVVGSWPECSARRDQRTWATSRVACVALGVAGLDTARPDAMTFAFMVLTPGKGLSWPRVRVLRPQGTWRGRVLSNASE
jgi:hypothetical protein